MTLSLRRLRELQRLRREEPLRLAHAMLEDVDDLLEAAAVEIGAATIDDPPLVQMREPTLAADRPPGSGMTWWHSKRWGVYGGEIEDADPLEFDEAKRRANSTSSTRGPVVYKSDHALRMVNPRITDLRQKITDYRYRLWRLERIRAVLEGLVR